LTFKLSIELSTEPNLLIAERIAVPGLGFLSQMSLSLSLRRMEIGLIPPGIRPLFDLQAVYFE
jgi:hypothetical protein